MMMLTDRLEALAQQITQGETMADIGTDHGFLPISLYRREICPRVIMIDVSEKALSRAKSHGEAVEGIGAGDYRVGNGLNALAPGEVDVVVIAGMGGILMTEILNDGKEKSKSFKKFIFQPRNHPEVLRYWLYKNGFVLKTETLVREGKNICEILVAVLGNNEESMLKKFPEMTSSLSKDIRWEIPPWYISLDSPLAEEYLNRKLEKEQRIFWAYGEGTNPKPERLIDLKQRILYIQELQNSRGERYGV
jgi:tRNA (adenine22-N1)-methyltransferase